MDGRLIDFRRGGEVEARRALEDLLDWTVPAREALGLEVALPDANGAQRARQALAEGMAIEEIYRGTVQETRRTYVGEEVGSR
jgi:carboxylate-amine ligase